MRDTKRGVAISTERPLIPRCFRGVMLLIAVWGLLAGTANAQVTRYVTPGGAGSINGTDWDNAYGLSGLQTAVNDAVAGGAGSVVYIKEGSYPLTAQLSISSAAGLTLSGGWVGAGGLPGTQGSAGTVLRRDPGVTTNRIINAANSTLTITNLTITDGYLSSLHGAGMCLTNCQTILANSRVVSNRLGSGTTYGIGIYANGGSLTLLDSEISGNSDQYDLYLGNGAGLYATSVNLAATNTVFADNNLASNGDCYGAGAYLNAGNARFVNCEFRGNYIRAGTGGAGTKGGGALYATNVVSLVLTNCTLTGNSVNNNLVRGGTIGVSGSGTTEIVNTRMDGNAYQYPTDLYHVHGDDLYLNVTGPVSLRDTEITCGSLRGIYKAGSGALSMTNCLIGGQPSHGMQTVAGTVTIANSTIAGNVGWGLTNSSSTITMTDSIIWNNRLGGITTNGLAMTYTCNQDDLAGAGNFNSDPRFVVGYRLSVNGLTGQTVNSPCTDAGSQTAIAAGLDTRTTRTDGAPDSGTVDLGYHYANAASGLENLTLYVDVNSGDDGHTGQSEGASLRSIGAALSQAIEGSTIHIAAGTYTPLYETFPLTIPYAGITLKGTNRNTTIINADATGNLLSITGKAGVQIEGLTFTNGVLIGNGAGMLLINSQTILTNCVLADCRVPALAAVATYGVGIYAVGGTLTILDSVLKNNHDESPYFMYGGAIYAKEVGLTMERTLFENNRVGANSPINSGGALHLMNGWATFSDCTFSTNYMRHTAFTPIYRGGCIYANGVNPLVFDGCTFTGNYAEGWGGSYGGVLYREGVGVTEIIDCVFENNNNIYSGEDIYFTNTGPAYIRDTIITGGSKHGIYKAGSGALSLTNVLISAQPQHGILAVAGTLSLANVTLANNAGWGLTNSDATVNLRDSILWGNVLGGVTTSGLTMIYTCNQDGLTDDGNFDNDPLFTLGYYLSVSGQPGQIDDSPCINAGSRTASVAGLDGRTTGTDGINDSGMADLGYHYASAAAGLENLTLYVDVNNGDEQNEGHSWEDALQSISAALTRAVDGSTIHIATGTYDTTYEAFPLTIQSSGITLKGTNRSETIINADASNRLLFITGKTGIRFEGLTFTNGVLNGDGAGMMLISSQTTLTNCVLTDCRAPNLNTYGVGIYAVGGTLTILDSVLKNQRDESGYYAYGGAIYAKAVGLTIERTLFTNNRVGGNNALNGGGALHLVDGWASLSDCTFSTNYMRHTSATTYRGGCIYANNVNPLVLDGCFFTDNYAEGRYASYGGVIFREGAGTTEITDCIFSNNIHAYSGEDLYFTNTGPAYIRDTIITAGSRHGIYKDGTGVISLTNSLVYAQPSNGVQVVAGSSVIASTTLADNGGWGLAFNGNNLDVENTIAWGNTNGGISATAAGTKAINYTLSQEELTGTSNQHGANPKFTASATGDYSLASGSPAINAGINRAWMTGSMDLAGEKRIMNGKVDLGAYESQGASGSVFLIR